jgi:hypothetical protein
MPVNDIIAEQTGVDPRRQAAAQQAAGAQQPAPQAQQAARAVQSTVQPTLQIDRGDLQVWIELAQLIVLLMILRKL